MMVSLIYLGKENPISYKTVFGMTVSIDMTPMEEPNRGFSQRYKGVS